ncbi:STAS domain-containing protein [Actinomadura roseirufa]|uniref:STAS domain-containing protein n=1 Tax=Actinomadura roseirufa TaxID=2094049 RepID=UPI001A955628|nr:STAS domain-containing protein [Actinomadura roseirufa]
MTDLRVVELADPPGMRVAGEIGVLNRDQWAAALDRALAACAGTDVHLELSELSFVDAGGTAVLAAVAQRLDGGRRVVLHEPPRVLDRILRTLWPQVPGIEVRPR